jgi:hypothetical protein
VFSGVTVPVGDAGFNRFDPGHRALTKAVVLFCHIIFAVKNARCFE